jgi:hypothetical protein
MATPDVRSAYELLRRAMQQQSANACWIPGGTPAYDPDGYGGPQGGLLGRLQALDAAQSPYQQPPREDSDARSTRSDPNFRALVRVPSGNQTQEAIDSSPLSDQPSPTYPLRAGAYSSSITASGANNPPLVGQSPATGSFLDALSALFGHPMVSRKDEDGGDDADREAIDSKTGDGKYPFCLDRWEDEKNRCDMFRRRNTSRYKRACEVRATKRLELCYANGGTPDPDEPDEYFWNDIPNPQEKPRLIGKRQ